MADPQTAVSAAILALILVFGTVQCRTPNGYETRPAECSALGTLEVCALPKGCVGNPETTLTPDHHIQPDGLITKDSAKEGI